MPIVTCAQKQNTQMQDSRNHTHKNKNTHTKLNKSSSRWGPQNLQSINLNLYSKSTSIKSTESINNHWFCQPSRMDQNQAKAHCTSVNPLHTEDAYQDDSLFPMKCPYFDILQNSEAGIGNRERVHHLSAAPNIKSAGKQSVTHRKSKH